MASFDGLSLFYFKIWWKKTLLYVVRHHFTVHLWIFLCKCVEMALQQALQTLEHFVWLIHTFYGILKHHSIFFHICYAFAALNHEECAAFFPQLLSFSEIVARWTRKRKKKHSIKRFVQFSSFTSLFRTSFFIWFIQININKCSSTHKMRAEHLICWERKSTLISNILLMWNSQVENSLNHLKWHVES